MKHLIQLTVIVLIAGISGIAIAQGRHHGPPPEAFEACEDLDVGDACTVETPRGSIEGVCGQSPVSDRVHCIPNEPPPRGRHHGPPPEAFEACENLEANDACSVETPHGTLEGTCGQGPHMDELHCIPNDPPPRRRCH